ncbi:A24 family peptidase [Ruegeria sp. HKCCD8929]|uniref:prepilin peptidase n=1 Tax=Ruegeria sp. HKCCD8929 TaxID=2683006 RepID=UPI001488C2E6
MHWNWAIVSFTLLYLLTYWCFAASGSGSTTLILLVPLLVWISTADFRHFIVPDLAVVGVTAVGLWIVRDDPLIPVVGAIVVGSFLWGASELFFRWTGKDGLGLGDVKLLGASTLCVGLEAIGLVIVLGSLSGVIAVLLARKNTPRAGKSGIPFAPFLAYALFLTHGFAPILQESSW